MIKFIHFRNRGAGNEGGVAVKGGKTIAYDDDAPVKLLLEDGTYNLQYAVALCHERDNFCRRTGRVKAEGRLSSERYVKTLTVNPDETQYEAFVRVEGL